MVTPSTPILERCCAISALDGAVLPCAGRPLPFRMEKPLLVCFVQRRPRLRQTSRHFTALTEAFISEGGTVDKFIGDAVMVFWNAPRPQHDHVERACRAALAAAAASDALNVEFETEGLPAFVVRIGIHVGEAIVGIVGSSERMEYTSLGTSVNLASRLEGLNKEYGTRILVSDAVHHRTEHAFHFNPIASVIAKGMTLETPIFELVEQIEGVGSETPQNTQL